MKRLTFLIGFFIISLSANANTFNFQSDSSKPIETLPYLEMCSDIEDEAERLKCSNENMIRIIEENFKYPSFARENGIEGTVIVSFIIRKDGTLDSLHVIKDIGYKCGDAAMDCIKALPKFSPGTQFGVPVDVVFNLPLKFGLEKRKKRKKRRQKKN